MKRENAVVMVFALLDELGAEELDKILAQVRQRPVGEPVAQPISDPRFSLLKTIEIMVPADYDHATRLDTFRRKHGKEFYYYNSSLTDENFDKATTRLVPGQKLKVKVFQITKSVSSEDCLNFLKSQNAILAGAQGASLAYEQGKDQLAKGRWYVSFDEKDTLPRLDGYHRVPYVGANSDGDFKFGLGIFGSDWASDYCLLCFGDLSAESASRAE